jgi:hypothetical protein
MPSQVAEFDGMNAEGLGQLLIRVNRSFLMCFGGREEEQEERAKRVGEFVKQEISLHTVKHGKEMEDLVDLWMMGGEEVEQDLASA